MEFSPKNHVVKLCLQGMSLEEKGQPEEAGKLFLQAWEEAADDLEKLISAHQLGQHAKSVSDKLKWFESALQFALRINDAALQSAFSPLYANIAQCYEHLNEPAKAAKNLELTASFNESPTDRGPFYHGTKANLHLGDLLTPGGDSNYRPDLKMNHIYFTALENGAGLAAALAKGDGPERVYIVEPTGPFENDPNVTNKKFPGNLTRSYRSQAPLRIVGELTNWSRQTPEDLQKWREKVGNNKGEIIN